MHRAVSQQREHGGADVAATSSRATAAARAAACVLGVKVGVDVSGSMSMHPELLSIYNAIYRNTSFWTDTDAAQASSLLAMLLVLAIVGLFFLPDPWRVIILVLAACFEVFEIFLWRKYLRRIRVRTGVEAMVGARAETLGPLDPAGRVRVRGEIWNARASSPVPDGAAVRIQAVEGLTLVVEPEQ
jgi:membrane protein implicated in regulation of membrane protease activity